MTRRATTLHLARPEDAAVLEIARLDFESAEHYAARCASIRALGVLWLRHPAYKLDARHSVHADVWGPAHSLWWQQVHEAAARDRQRNPAYLKAQDVRNAVGGR